MTRIPNQIARKVTEELQLVQGGTGSTVRIIENAKNANQIGFRRLLSSQPQQRIMERTRKILFEARHFCQWFGALVYSEFCKQRMVLYRVYCAVYETDNENSKSCWKHIRAKNHTMLPRPLLLLLLPLSLLFQAIMCGFCVCWMDHHFGCTYRYILWCVRQHVHFVTIM